MATIEQQRRLREAARNERRRRKETGSPNSAYVKVYERPSRPISKTPIARPDRPVSKTPVSRPDRPVSITPVMGFNSISPKHRPVKPTLNGAPVRTHAAADAPAIRPAPKVAPIARVMTTTSSKKLGFWAKSAVNNQRLAKSRMIKASRKG